LSRMASNSISIPSKEEIHVKNNPRKLALFKENPLNFNINYDDLITTLSASLKKNEIPTPFTPPTGKFIDNSKSKLSKTIETKDEENKKTYTPKKAKKDEKEDLKAVHKLITTVKKSNKEAKEKK